MRHNRNDAPLVVPSAGMGVPGKTESRFADIEHELELRMEVVRSSDVRRRRASGETRLDRLVEIRRRISSGAYDSIDVRESVARKILDRHDL